MGGKGSKVNNDDGEQQLGIKLLRSFTSTPIGPGRTLPRPCLAGLLLLIAVVVSAQTVTIMAASWSELQIECHRVHVMDKRRHFDVGVRSNENPS